MRPTPCSHYQSLSPQNLNAACVSCPVVHSTFRTAKLREPIRSIHRLLNPLLSSFRERCAVLRVAFIFKLLSNLPQAESFQSDIYPPVPSTEPSVTAGEFFKGKTPTLNLVSLADGSSVAASSTPTTFTSAPPTPVALPPTAVQPTRSYTASAPAPAPAPIAAPPMLYSVSESVATPTTYSPIDFRAPKRSQTSDSRVRVHVVNDSLY